MADLLFVLSRLIDGWPRRVDNALFVSNGRGIDWVSSTAALFGWIASRTHNPEWHRGRGMVTKDELYEELRRSAKCHAAVELIPHVPPVEGHYYAVETPAPGDGTAIAWLLDRLTYETTVDRDLVEAAFATTIWGGIAGARPAFASTANTGRGKGNSTAAKLIGDVVGGLFDFDAKDEIGAIKTRLLTTAEATKRLALLDNVKSHRFSWAGLGGIITAREISGKRLYLGEGTRPNLLTWFITLNGASLSTDMALRSVIFKLGEPKYDGDWETDTHNFIKTNRDRLIADLVAFFQRPRHEFTRYSRWATWERDVLSRVRDPEAAQAAILVRQAEADVEHEEAEIIESYFAERLAEVSYDIDAKTVFLPSKLVATWFCEATNERNHSSTAVTRALKQMHGEGRLQHITPGKCNAYGRGFVWRGSGASGSDKIRSDIASRIETLPRRYVA